MRSRKLATVLTAILALAGSAAADVAWDVITANPELTTTAALLEELGMKSSLSRSIYGTLLLPTNTAWSDYISDTDYLPTLDAFGGKAETSFFAALVRYHWLLSSVPNSYGYPSTGSYKTYHVQQPGNVRHKVMWQDVGDSGNPSYPRSTTAKVVLGLYVVTDEKGGSASINSSSSQMVDGGGYIHVIDAVLQPNDLHKSVRTLMSDRPVDLGNAAELLKTTGLRNMWSNECKWISDDAFTNQAYEAIQPSSSDTCVPCSDPNDCGPYSYDDPKVENSPGGLLAFVDMIKDNWDDRVFRAIVAGTLGLEKFAGTYLLPSNKALPDLTKLAAKQILPTLQYHFIPVAGNPVQFSSDQLVRFDRNRFRGMNPHKTLLGQMTNNGTYQITFVATGSGSRLVLKVNFPTVRRLDSAYILDGSFNRNASSINQQTPNVLYHVIDKMMIPPCETDAICFKSFKT